MNRIRYLFPLMILFLTGCLPSAPAPTPSATLPPPSMTPQPSDTPTPTSTTTPVLVQVSAIVWTQPPLVPILTYHQFKPDGSSPSDKSGHKIQLGDLRASLQNLYDSGFSLVSMEDWLAGDMTVPPGRRPLILSMDDLFYRNQILLDESGNPQPDTGIGVIWQFAQEHPDFGFHLALFAVLGDKFYPFDPQYYPGLDWEREFARVIVWCIENDAMIYNHAYLHGYLDYVEKPVTMNQFIQQLQQNDERLRRLLTLPGREDLIPRLENIIALPGGAEPQTESDWASLRTYQNPEGQPVQAVLGIYSAATDPATFEYFTGPYDPGFDRYRIPRIVASLFYVQYLVDHSEEFPAAQSCTLSLEEIRAQDDLYLGGQIHATIQSGACPSGLYMLDGKLFDAR